MQIRLELGIIDVDDNTPKPAQHNAHGGGDSYYRGALAAGMYTPSSNVTMSDDDDAFSQLDDDDGNWR